MTTIRTAMSQLQINGDGAVMSTLNSTTFGPGADEQGNRKGARMSRPTMCLYTSRGYPFPIEHPVQPLQPPPGNFVQQRGHCVTNGFVTTLPHWAQRRNSLQLAVATVSFFRSSRILNMSASSSMGSVSGYPFECHSGAGRNPGLCAQRHCRRSQPTGFRPAPE